MRWQGERQSDNVEDRRDESYGGGEGYGTPFPGAGGGFQIPIPGGGGGIIGILAIIGIALLFGVDPSILLNGGSQGFPGGGRQIQMPQESARKPAAVDNDQMVQFVSTVLASTEDVWADLFRQQGRQYQRPKLVLFRGSIRSACGHAVSQMGPFYCPNDRKVYIDLSFYDELKRRFRAPGEFAQAYVIAHEIGHHVQNLQGRLQLAQRAQAASSGTAQRNAIQVRVELQADCYAGVWARSINKLLEPGDIEAALRAASAIGDDKIQEATRGYSVPDSFTHGSSEQRVRWFRHGYDTGKIEACDTFSDSSI